MKTINLVDDFDGDIFVYSRAYMLKPDEMFYVRLKSLSEITEEVEKLIIDAAFLSSNVILSIPAEDFDNTELTWKYFMHGVKGFALRTSHSVSKWLKHQGIGQFNSGDRDVIDLYQNCIGLLPEGKELAIEFQTGDDLRVLGPTITGLYELGLRWVVFNVDDPATEEKAAKFREVFEYLRIRGCTKLNAYFPFWSESFREWDLKTLNTFSGLEFVHLDISNRCTHSCVFCGLYGHDSIEDIKGRTGGFLPDDLKAHMKKEIDGERCLAIIKSLPWSVRAIQFGGFGDPLMHEKAVEFIAATRKRGFRVEILSNMEYLKDEDIEMLSKLGGDNFHDLHFIANISAATPELYVKTRPKQTAKTFEKIIHNISLFSKLRNENNGSGAHFTIMCVVTSLNCENLFEMAKLAHELGSAEIWFKPMEIHHSTHSKYIPQKDQMPQMVKSLKEALKYADENNVRVVQRDYCEEIIRRHSTETAHV